MRKMVLLNVGPVNISREVREAMLLPDLCHREVEFTEILNRVRDKLNTVFRGGNQCSTVILGGSGTASLEAVISSFTVKRRLLVLSNGYYGEKLARIAQIHDIDMRALKYDWGKRIEEADVEEALDSDPRIDSVAMVHNETSVGILNPVNRIGELISRYQKKFIVDAISSVGAEDLDVIRDRIHFCVGSPNKCIESVPGLSFVCADKQELEKLRHIPAKTSYLDLYNHYAHEQGLGERPGTPFTPPVQAYYALDVALGLLIKEGVENRRKRYASAAKRIRDGLQKFGFRLFLPPEYMCNSITSVVTPKNIPYRTIHDKLKQRGFVIYAGQGNLEQEMFRIGNMGALTMRDIDRFLDSFESILKEMKKYPRYK